jgi:lysine 6-dehydrogenase
LNYELVFSANGLINEYVEPALVLEQGKIVEKPSMTEIETLKFPDPFGEMEAFITSGGSSTLPYTYQDKIQYLDYKTIRYPGHCEKMKTLLDLGFGSTESIAVNSVKVVPKQVLITLLKKHLPSSQQDVVLLRVKSNVKKKNALFELTYELIDYFEKKTGFTAMMRTTGFPVSITADFIARNVITNHGVFCPEEIIPPQPFFDELRKRNIDITITERNLNEE